jgi:hypothetical protein
MPRVHLFVVFPSFGTKFLRQFFIASIERGSGRLKHRIPRPGEIRRRRLVPRLRKPVRVVHPSPKMRGGR